MQIYTLEEVLSAPYILDEWRPDLIQNLWDSFTSENVRITIVGQKLQECNEKEKWYQTSYRTEKITKEAAERWRNCGTNANLHLPDPNVFIPTDFTILPIEKEDQKSPTIVLDNELIRVWHLQDSVFLKPKMILSCEFSNPAVYSDPLNCNLTHIFVQLFKDHLNEYLYAADLAGLRLSVNNTTYGISVRNINNFVTYNRIILKKFLTLQVLVSGYNHKQKVFLEKILDHLFKFEIDEKRFEILKEQYKRSLKNFNAEQPYQQAIYYLALILTEQAWLKQELIDATESKLY